MTDKHLALSALIDTMATLRGEGGCPWDAEQTHETLVPYLLEEVFELVEAIETGNRADLREELGDVFYQLLFHADIAAADSSEPFDIDDVAAGVDHKMRHRHPHVFGDGDASTVEEVTARWEDIKTEEKKHRSSVLEGIPERLSALARASSTLKRSAGVVDFSPTHETPVFSSEEQLGDYLLTLVHSARSAGLNPETALRQAT
ncbi:MAG: MazG family protein, partial [Pontimonas sp.]|nr:MazG family protein [Pontimonas sp.]